MQTVTVDNDFDENEIESDELRSVEPVVRAKEEFDTLKSEQFNLEDKLKVILEEFELQNSVQLYYAQQKQKGKKMKYSHSKQRMSTKTKEQQILSIINEKFRMKFNNKQIRKAVEIVKEFEQECEERKSRLVEKYKEKLSLLHLDEDLMYVTNEADESATALSNLKEVYEKHSHPDNLALL